MTKQYKSKVSLTLWVFIWFFVLGAIYVTFNLINAYSIFQPLIAVVIWLIIISLFLFVMLETKYIVSDGDLIVKIGPYTERKIPIRNIGYLERSYNISASPANAIKRIKLTHIDGEVFISPSQETSFVKALKEINPSIQSISL